MSVDSSARILPSVVSNLGSAERNRRVQLSFYGSRQTVRRQGRVAFLPAPAAEPLRISRSFAPESATAKATRQALRAAELAAWRQNEARLSRRQLRRRIVEETRTQAESFCFGLVVLVASVGIAFGLSDSFRAVMRWDQITAFISRWIG